MKTALLLFSLLSGVALGVDAQQLLEGASAVVAMEAGDKTLIQDGRIKATRFASYMEGFINGVNVADVIAMTESPKVSNPDEWMLNPKIVAPSVVAFIQQNKPKDIKLESIPAYMMAMAWYAKEHSASSPMMKSAGFKTILDIAVEDIKNPDKSEKSPPAPSTTNRPSASTRNAAAEESRKRYLEYLRRLRDERAQSEAAKKDSDPAYDKKMKEAVEGH